MVASRAYVQGTFPPIGEDRSEVARAEKPEKAAPRRPLKARRPAEHVDAAAAHLELVDRYPVIRARLAE